MTFHPVDCVESSEQPLLAVDPAYVQLLCSGSWEDRAGGVEGGGFDLDGERRRLNVCLIGDSGLAAISLVLCGDNGQGSGVRGRGGGEEDVGIVVVDYDDGLKVQ